MKPEKIASAKYISVKTELEEQWITLKNQIISCMSNCNTYLVCSRIKDDNEDPTEIVGIAIVEIHIEMTTSEKRSLIH